MVELNRYARIIWDWNGTLLDDAWLCVEVMNTMLAERNMPLKSLAQYREMFDFPVRNYYEKLGYDFEKEPFDIVGMEFIHRYNKRHFETNLHPGVHEVLEYFRQKKYIQYILSAREQAELLAETEKLGVNSYFTVIRGLDDHYAHGKTETGKQLIAELGISRQETLFIGDTRHDAEVAGELGIDCLLVSHGHHSERRLKELPFPVLQHLTELLNGSASQNNLP